MKKTLWLLAALLTLSALPARADNTGMVGLGVIAGSPFGVTAKYWWSDLLSFDGGIGYGNAGVFYADAALNSWTLLPNTGTGRTNLYVAAGPRIATDDGGQFGIRAMVGAGYWPSSHPVELFAEVGPTFKITPDSTVGLDGGIGFRYYFTLSVSPAHP